MPIATINVTPLIDVMLVLLILFMLITPVAPRSLDAALPRPADGRPATPSLVLTIDSDVYGLNRAPVTSLSDLDGRFRDAFRAGASRTVLVQVVGRPSYGRVVEAMDVATGAGAERLGLLAPR